MTRSNPAASGEAVLLMAYGTPERLADVEAYFTDIRGGRTPSPAAVEHLRARYTRVAGKGDTNAPLLAITRQVRERLEASLAASGAPQRVYMGMRHWHPYIADTMRQMRDDGVQRVTALALAPHYSRMSIGAYRRKVEEAQEALGHPFVLHFVERWGDDAAFLDLIAALVKQGLLKFADGKRAAVTIVFTAHSLPERIREWNDPYEAELLASARAVAARLELDAARWRFAWQSAGGTGEAWIGPGILECLDTLRGEGVRDVLQVPIGFVSDHLEILYDIDIEAKERAAALGMHLERTELPNATPAFIAVLTGLILRHRAKEATNSGA